MTQSINTTTKATCLQATPAFQLPAARARPGPGGGIRGPWARPACLASPDPKPRALGWRGAAPGAGWGRGTLRAHQRRTSSTAALAPIRMRYACAAAAGMPRIRTRCSTRAHPDPAHIRGRAGCVRCRRPEAGRRGRCWGCRCGWGEIHARAHTPGRATYRPHTRAGARTHIRV